MLKFQVAAILKQLETEPKLQLFYLHQLRKKEAIVYDAKIHDLQVQLYADHDLPNLLDFLQKVRLRKDEKTRIRSNPKVFVEQLV